MRRVIHKHLYFRLSLICIVIICAATSCKMVKNSCDASHHISNNIIRCFLNATVAIASNVHALYIAWKSVLIIGITF